MSAKGQKVIGSSRDKITIDELDDSETLLTQYAVSTNGSVAAVRSRSVEETFSPGDRALQVWKYLLGVFLPAGYPHSVTEDYINYQIYDSLQAFCSSIAGLLSSRAVLSSVGVGDSTASPTSALLLSVLQESTGRVATILFAHRLGTSLEPECKAYRLAADVFNDAAMILDCLSPAFPRAFRVAILSGSSVLRSLCGVAAGSAKASLSAHFARRGNLGEVNAKDSSQETVISLVGMLAGTVVVSTVTSTWATWVAMLLLLGLHLAMNYLAVCAVNMNTLNRQRANIVFGHLMSDQEAASSKALSPAEVSSLERIFRMDGTLEQFHFPFRSQSPTRSRVGFVEMGVPLGRLAAAAGEDAAAITELLRIFEHEDFVLWPSAPSQRAFIVFKENASSLTILKAWVLALQEACASTQQSSKEQANFDALRVGLTKLNDRWAGYLDRVNKAGWDLDTASIETGKARRLRFRKEE